MRIFLSLLIMVLLMGCDPFGYKGELPKYVFQQKVRLAPFKKAYHIGDTLTLSFASAGFRLYDTLSKSLVPADSLSFGAYFGLVGITGFPRPVPPNNYFDLISSGGLNYGRDTAAEYLSYSFRYSEYVGCKTDSNYHFSLQLIPREKGFYYLSLNDTQIGACSNRTRTFPNSILNYRFDLTDCNSDLLPGLQDTVQHHNIKAGLDQKSYFLVMVE